MSYKLKQRFVSLLAVIAVFGGLGLAASPAAASEDGKGGRHCIRTERCLAQTTKGMPSIVTAKTPLAPVKALFTCPCYYYGQGQATVASSTTSSANLTVWKPTVTAGDFHSLVELSVADSTQSNIVEVGWNVDSGVNGD